MENCEDEGLSGSRVTNSTTSSIFSVKIGKKSIKPQLLVSSVMMNREKMVKKLEALPDQCWTAHFLSV